MTRKSDEYREVADVVDVLEEEGCEVVAADTQERPVDGLAAMIAKAWPGDDPTETLVSLLVRPGDGRVPYPDTPTADDIEGDDDDEAPDYVMAPTANNPTRGQSSDTVEVDRDVLESLIEVSEYKIQTDVANYESDPEYDLDAVVADVEEARAALQEGDDGD